MRVTFQHSAVPSGLEWRGGLDPALKRRAILARPSGTPRPLGLRGGIVLIECLIYISILAVLFTVGIQAFHQMQLRSARIQRNAADIARVLHAGEQWRGDIRRARSAEWDSSRNALSLEIDDASVTYVFEKNFVSRKTGSGPATRFLPNVKASQMKSEQRSIAEVWTWDVELSAAERNSRIKPIFTFIGTRRNVP